MAGLHGAVLHGVEHLQRRHDLAGREHADLELAARDLADAVCDLLGAAVDRVEALRERGLQPPLHDRQLGRNGRAAPDSPNSPNSKKRERRGKDESTHESSPVHQIGGGGVPSGQYCRSSASSGTGMWIVLGSIPVASSRPQVTRLGKPITSATISSWIATNGAAPQ